MKNFSNYFLMLIVFMLSGSIHAQVGIGTTTPDASSALDISSNSKGLLMPRLSTTERDEITDPATGLMIYNYTLNDGQLNIGTPATPNWVGLKGQEGSGAMITSVTLGDAVGTSATENLLVPGMVISPLAGKYLVLFNAQVSSNQTFSSDQGVTDVKSIYADLMAYPGGESHSLVFGNGEILAPGVYDVNGAPSIGGTLTLDGGGDSNAVFIIRGSGAFTTGASTTVTLINGASSNNIFWVSGAAMSTGA